MTTTLPSTSPARDSLPGGSSDSRWGRFGSLVATVLAVAVMVTSLGGWALLSYYDGKIRRIPGLGSMLSQAGDGPLTILVVGSDTRTGLTEAEKRKLSVAGVGDVGRRSDTMMLVHVSGDRERVTVVSLPRDSYVTIPSYANSDGTRQPAHRDKLNAAYALGGAPLLITTVQQLTGLTINHYVEVGFAGVVRMVDAMGGVDVCVPNAVNDRRSGLTLPAGTSHVDGAMGLSFVRARYIDPTADLGRMERQQQFLASMFRQATSAGVLLRPDTLNAFLDAALSSVTVDEALTRDALLDLASDLQTLEPRNLRLLTVPLGDVDAYADGVGSVVLWDRAKSRQLFDALADDEPLARKARRSHVTIPPANVKVQVLNGSAVSGLASQASEDLADAGFVIAASPDNAERSDVTTTVIQYDPVWSESVKTLQAAFPGSQLEAVDGLGGTFRVLVGTGYSAPVPVRVVEEKDPIDSSSAADSVCG